MRPCPPTPPPKLTLIRTNYTLSTKVMGGYTVVCGGSAEHVEKHSWHYERRTFAALSYGTWKYAARPKTLEPSTCTRRGTASTGVAAGCSAPIAGRIPTR